MPGYDLMVRAISGMMSLTGDPDGPPYRAGSMVPHRMGNAHSSVFPYEPLPTADNDLVVTAGDDGQFRKLCEVLGIPAVYRLPPPELDEHGTELREWLSTPQEEERG